MSSHNPSLVQTRRGGSSTDRLLTAVLVLAVASALPYLIFKVLWLSGVMIGVTSGRGSSLMTDSRHVVGNYLTVAMDLLAIGLAIALSRRWSHRIPAWLLVIPAWVATGLLAPIAVGLPLGLGVQTVVTPGRPVGSLDGLGGWVFAIIYGGFTILGCCLAMLFAVHALRRWPAVARSGVRASDRRLMLLCGVPLLGYAGALLVWSVAGPGLGGPVGFDSVAQRTVLAVTGALVAAGFLAPLSGSLVRRHPHWSVIMAWVGGSVAALSGPTFVALSHDGIVPPPLLVAASVSAPAAVLYSIAVFKPAVGRR